MPKIRTRHLQYIVTVGILFSLKRVKTLRVTAMRMHSLI